MESSDFVRIHLMSICIICRLFSFTYVGDLLTKVAELVPAMYLIDTVVGVKYIKFLDKNFDPRVMESICIGVGPTY